MSRSSAFSASPGSSPTPAKRRAGASSSPARRNWRWSAGAARRRGLLERLAWPRLSADVRQFFRALAPAIIGSAGVQIAIFADTIIASLLPTGVVSSIYYAERLYQLPIGVIGVAAGTVLLPEMSRRLARGDEDGAFHAQNRTMAISLALAAPFCVAFLLIPEPHHPRRVHARRVQRRGGGQFGGGARRLRARLMPIVLIRSAVASFQARGDTTTPMVISLAAIAVNVGAQDGAVQDLRSRRPGARHGGRRVGQSRRPGGVGVAAGMDAPDLGLTEVAAAAFFASGALALALTFAEAPALAWARGLARWSNEAEFGALAAIGAVAYALALGAGLLVTGARLAKRRA